MHWNASHNITALKLRSKLISLRFSKALCALSCHVSVRFKSSQAKPSLDFPLRVVFVYVLFLFFIKESLVSCTWVLASSPQPQTLIERSSFKLCQQIHHTCLKSTVVNKVAFFPLQSFGGAKFLFCQERCSVFPGPGWGPPPLIPWLRGIQSIEAPDPETGKASFRDHWQAAAIWGVL